MIKNVIRLISLVSLGLFLSACGTMHSYPTLPGSPIVNSQKNNTAAANANTQLGLGYLQQGDVQKAKQKLLTAISQDPNSASTRDAMAYFMENTGEQQKAEQSYLKAIELNPTAGSTQNNYGAFLCRAKRYQEADKHFMLAVQDPNYLKTAEVYENAGLCAMQIPDDQKATAYFQKAVAQDPSRVNSYLELGQLSFKRNDYPQAQKYLDQYMNAATDPSPEALWLGVRLARAQNDNVKAGSYAVTLQSRYPSSSEARLLRNTKVVKPEVSTAKLDLGIVNP